MRKALERIIATARKELTEEALLLENMGQDTHSARRVLRQGDRRFLKLLCEIADRAFEDPDPLDFNGEKVSVGDVVRFRNTGSHTTVKRLGKDHGVWLFQGSGYGGLTFRVDKIVRLPDPVDINGNRITAGDVVISPDGRAEIVSEASGAGVWGERTGSKPWPPFNCTRLGSVKEWVQKNSLTREEYLPLARRTMDPGMTRKERLAMLAMGTVGEMNEFIRCRKKDRILEEAGDVLWYAEQLLEEVGHPKRGGSVSWDDTALWEQVKKAIFHGVGEVVISRLAAEAVREVSAYVQLGEARASNIKKLMRRYPGGFVAGGGIQ